jgi:hypothetical protein
VLARPDALAVAPYLHELGAEQRHTATRTAYRGLLARGIVDPPSATALAAARAAADGRIDLPVREDVRSVVTLREAAQLVVAVARTTSSTRDYWYAYLVQEVVLLEQVSSDGIHRFALGRRDQLLDLVAAAAMHPNSGDAIGHAVAMPAAADDPPPTPILGQLGQSLLRADLVVRHPGEQHAGTLGLFTGPRGSWLVTGQGGATPMAHPMSADALRAQVRQVVEQIRSEAVSAGARA